MRCQLNKKILLLIFEVIPGFPALVKAEQVKLMKKNDFFHCRQLLMLGIRMKKVQFKAI